MTHFNNDLLPHLKAKEHDDYDRAIKALSSCSSPSACSASTSSKQDGPNDGERLWENMTLEERKAQIDKCLDATNTLANRVLAEAEPFPPVDYVPPPTDQPDECMPNAGIERPMKPQKEV